MRSFVFFASIILSVSLGHAAERVPFVVVLDPGHGGEDNGTIHYKSGYYLIEKKFSLELAFRVADSLRAQGIPVVMTRTSDQTISLEDRSQIANRWAEKADSAIFLSIHANSSHNHESAGVETYVLNSTDNASAKRLAVLENGSKKAAFKPPSNVLDLILTDLSTSANYADSRRLACLIQRRSVRGLRDLGYKPHSRGVKEALFYVLLKTKIPGVLFEPGFASNKEELRNLVSPTYQRFLADSLVQSILQYRAQTLSPALLASNPSAISGIKKRAYPQIPEENEYCR